MTLRSSKKAFGTGDSALALEKLHAENLTSQFS